MRREILSRRLSRMITTILLYLTSIGTATVLILLIVLLIGYLWHKWWLWNFDRVIGWKDIKKGLEEKSQCGG